MVNKVSDNCLCIYRGYRIWSLYVFTWQGAPSAKHGKVKETVQSRVWLSAGIREEEEGERVVWREYNFSIGDKKE